MEVFKMDKTIKRSTETKTYRLMDEINRTITRSNFNGDFYESAMFTVNGVYYCMNNAGNSLYRWNTKDGEWRMLSKTYVKRGIYSAYKLGGFELKSYVLALLCLTDGFFEKYFSDKNLVVNHCVSTFDERIGYCPNRCVDSDVRYLEVVQHRANVKHGSFIHMFGLTDLYVSASDIKDLLPDMIIDDVEHNRAVIKEYYLNKKPVVEFC